MATITITTCVGSPVKGWNWSVEYNSEQTPQYTKWDPCVGVFPVGDEGAGTAGSQDIRRAAVSFNLADLPADSNVAKVELEYNILTAGGANGKWDFRSYGLNAQDYPCDDGAQDCFNKCYGNRGYVTGSTNPRTTGPHTETLGDGESAQACTDLEACKAAGKKFNLGFCQNPEDEPDAIFWHTAVKIKITYTPPPEKGGPLAQIM